MSDLLARAREMHKIVASGSVKGPAAAFEHNTYAALFDVAEAARELRDGGHAVTFTEGGQGRSCSISHQVTLEEGKCFYSPLTSVDPAQALLDALATLEARIEEETDE